MKIKIGVLTLIVILCCGTSHAFKRGGGFNEADLEMEQNSIVFAERSSDPATPSTDKIAVYLKDDSGTSKLYTKTAAGTVTALGGGSLGANDTIQSGTNPTVDAAGEVGIDTSATSGSAFTFYGDAQYTLPGWQSLSFTIDTPVSASDYPIRQFIRPVTIRAIKVTSIAGTNVVGGLDEADANGANGVAIDADITCSSGTVAADDGSLSNAAVDANDWLLWHTTSVSGSVTSVTVTVWWTWDAVA